MLKEFHKVTELNNSLNQTETFSKYFCKKVRVGHCVILRSAHNVLLHSFKERNILFSNFLLLMKPKRTLRSFEKNALSFWTLKKNAMFFYAFFFRVKKELKCSFLEFFATYETQKNVAFFLKESGFFKKNVCSFEKNARYFKRTHCIPHCIRSSV